MVFYTRAEAITPSNTVDITSGLADGIYAGGAGDIAAVFQDGSTATFTVVAGQFLPIRVRRVNATGTTATALVALFGRFGGWV